MTGQLPFEIPNESQFIKRLARLDILVATHRNSVLEKIRENHLLMNHAIELLQICAEFI